VLSTAGRYAVHAEKVTRTLRWALLFGVECLALARLWFAERTMAQRTSRLKPVLQAIL
jgi:hypothetical protein